MYVSRCCDDVIAIWTLLARMFNVANVDVDLVAEAWGLQVFAFFAVAFTIPPSLYRTLLLCCKPSNTEKEDDLKLDLARDFA